MNRSTFFVKRTQQEENLMIKRTGGHIDHYYHFIIDFLWPLYHWSFLKFDLFNEPLVIKSLDPKAIFFQNILSEISSIRIEKHFLASKLFNRVELPLKHKIHGFNPNYHDYRKTFQNIEEYRQSHKNFQTSILSKLKISSSLKPSIILIERKSSGKPGDVRRSIKNHTQLLKALRELGRKAGIEVNNIDLSQRTLKDQVQTFFNGDIIIGQHGAGLINAIWMNQKRGLLIELEGTKNRKHFSNLCYELNIPYLKIIGESRSNMHQTEELTINQDQVIGEVERHLNLVSQ